MTKKIIFIVLSGFFVIPAFSQHPPQDKNWDTTFMDNFNTFNSSLWWKDNNAVHGDSIYEEPQVYSQDDTYIAYIDGSNKLVLRTRRLDSPYQWTNPQQQCPQGNNCLYGGNHYYTSGQIQSDNQGKGYRYGYFEIYAKLPLGTAFWPAFWLWKDDRNTPNCWYNEIDIMEANGFDPSWISSNYWGYFNCPVVMGNIPAVHHPCNYAKGSYHWYGVEWDSEKITWYVDRKAVRQIPNNIGGTGIQKPLNIIINLALFPINQYLPYPINDALFPAYMYVDQANAYKLKYDCNTVVNEIPNFNTFNYAVKKSITLSGATTIPSGSNISLRATDFIELKDGFTVANGAELYLDNNPCDGISSNSRTK